MNQLSLIEKFKVLLEITKSNIFYPIIILFLMFISFLFITTNKNNSKESKKTYCILYAIILIIVLIKYESSLATMFDYMMNNLFIVFYFPNIAVYIAAIIITNIIMWISMFSNKSTTIIKIINSIIFSIIHYLFIINLNIITTKNINVFSEKALYQNHNVHALIELSSNIFIIWIIFLVIYKIVLSYLESKKTKQIYESSELTVEHIGAKEPNKQKVIHLPDNVKEVTAPYIVKREMSKTKIVYELPKQTENTAIYEQMLTLEDYKLLVSLLKEQEKNGVKKILLNKNKSIKSENIETEVAKEKDIEQEDKNENKLSELMALYKSVS